MLFTERLLMCDLSRGSASETTEQVAPPTPYPLDALLCSGGNDPTKKKDG
jgi:hypothetical protein